MADFLLSPHFTLKEMTWTDTGIANSPNPEQLSEMVMLCTIILEPVRLLLGPIKINSGFRTLAVNDRIHGAKTTQHMKGQAADIVPITRDLEFAFQWIKATEIPFDQLIIEQSWIHVSMASMGKTPRRQTLRAHMTDQGMVYESA